MGPNFQGQTLNLLFVSLGTSPISRLAVHPAPCNSVWLQQKLQQRRLWGIFGGKKNPSNFQGPSLNLPESRWKLMLGKWFIFFWGGIQGLFLGAFAVELGLRECHFATIFVQFALHFCCSLFLPRGRSLDWRSYPWPRLASHYSGKEYQAISMEGCHAPLCLFWAVMSWKDLIQSKTIKNKCAVSNFMSDQNIP